MIKWTFLVLLFPVPVAFLPAGIGHTQSIWLDAAFLAHFIGLQAERWFFFAQARHPQNLYYQVV